MAEESAAANQRERERADAVRATGLWNTEAEPDFDDLVELARDICKVPISAITLLDESTQFVKAATVPVNRLNPRSESFCTFALGESEAFTVPDTRRDARFADHPWVTLQGLRFYSGIPVRSEGGLPLGTLCVADTEPRELDAKQERALRVLALQVEARMHLRTRIRAVQERAAVVEAERELLHHFLDNMPMEAALKDAEGRLLFYNQAIADQFRIDRQEWLGKTDLELWGEEKGGILRSEEANVLRTGKRQESYIELPAPDGASHYWKIIRSCFALPDGAKVLATIGLNLTQEMEREAQLMRLQDELEEANRKLRSLSLTDALTGLWNRRAFDERFEAEIVAADRRDAALTLLMIDVDDFKTLNDTYGHAHGDEVLAKVGGVLRQAVRPYDVACRYGGEEFAIVLPGAGLEGGVSLARRVAQMLLSLEWTRRSVTVSVGIATYKPSMSLGELLRNADLAMYRAKRSGKNRALIYEPEPEPAVCNGEADAADTGAGLTHETTRR